MKRAKTGTEELLQQMANGVVPVEDAERAARRREKVVARMRSLHVEIRADSARSRLRGKIGIVAAAAVLLAGLGAAAHLLSGWPRQQQGGAVSRHAPARPALEVAAGTVLLKRPGAAQPTAPAGRVALASGDEVLTRGDGRATVTLASGSEVRIAPLTELTVSSPEAAGWLHESVRLDRGRIDVHVLPLPPGGSFVVVTPDASVQVRGTRFTVIVEDRDGVLGTRVEVRKGHVLVRDASGQALLAPGASWTSRPVQRAPAAVKASPLAPPGHVTGSTGATAGVRPNPQATPASAGAAAQGTRPPSSEPRASAEPSTLAEQNRLYQAAMNARRSGDDRSALGLLDQLLTRYPRSPLQQDAQVERFRALARLGQKQAAARAARRYLAEHPEGFARAEARQLALAPGSTSQAGPQ